MVQKANALTVLTVGGELFLQRRQFGKGRIGIDRAIALARGGSGRELPMRWPAIAPAFIAAALVTATLVAAATFAATAKFALVSALVVVPALVSLSAGAAAVTPSTGASVRGLRKSWLRSRRPRPCRSRLAPSLASPVAATG